MDIPQWAPIDVYELTDIAGDEDVLIYGQCLLGMEPESRPNYDKSIMPIAWVMNYTSESVEISSIFNTTMGVATDFKSESLRRHFVNAAYWCMEMKIFQKSNVQLVGQFDPTDFGFNK